MDPLSLLLFFVLFLLSGFFSASEIALMAIAKHKVDSLLKQQRFFARDLEYIKSKNDRLLVTILIGNNLVNVYIAALATQIAINFADTSNLEQSLAIGLATGIVTFLLLMFGEIVPKSFATKNAESISLLVAKPYKYLMILLTPVLFIIEVIIKITTGKDNIPKITDEEIESFIDMGKTSGTLEANEHEKLKNMLEFADITVEEILTPRVKIDAVNLDTTIKEAIDFVLGQTHSRIPVYDGTIDNIEYVINLRFLLSEQKKGHGDRKLSEIKNLDKAIKIPLNHPIDKLLEIFRNSRKHIAIVIDEYGGVAGLVTLEDIIEEVFGEIRDEYDIEADEIKKVGENKYEFDSGVNLEELLETFELDFIDLGLNENEYHAVTISYFITQNLERFPNPGEILEFFLLNSEGEETGEKLVFRVQHIFDGKIENVEVERVLLDEKTA